MATFVPLSNPEKNNESSFFASLGAGLASGVIKTIEGVVSLGAELIDLGADSNVAGDVEKFFDKINVFEDTAQSRLSGKLTETLLQIGIPGGAGFRLGTKLADKAIKAKKAGTYANFKSPSVMKGAETANRLNRKAGLQRFAAGVAGGAAGETLVADTEDIGTFGDFFDGPTALDRDEETGRGEAVRKLLNRLKFGSESVIITPFVYGAGTAGKALAQRGKDLAYSNSAFERWVNKYIGSPFRPRGDLPEEVFAAEMQKAGLKASDTFRAKEIVDNITRETDKIFPRTQKLFDTTTEKEQTEFYKKLNDLLFEGDLTNPINREAKDNLVAFMRDKKIDPKSISVITKNLDDARFEFTNLITILKNNQKGVEAATGTKDIKKLLKERVQGWVGNTYKIFQNKSGLAKLLQTEPYTDEAYRGAVNLFRRYLSKTDPKRTKPYDPNSTEYIEQARFLVDDIVNQVKIKGRPGPLPDFKYTDGTMMTQKTKSFEKAVGKGSKVFRQLFGEIEDPRYSVFNAITNLSAVARTATYLDDIAKKNADVQAAGGRGFFWADEAVAKQAVNSPQTGIEIVDLYEDVIKQLPGNKVIVSSVPRYTTKEIAEGIKNANNIGTGLTSIIRGRQGANPAEKAVTWFYRNLLLFPKAISQLAKTVLSIPTHLRNFFSAGAFAGANGILFEGLTNPGLLKRAFSEGVDVSALLKLGPGSARAQAAYRELLELGVVNSQVQIGDLINLLRDAGGGANIAQTDALLKPMFRKLKKVGQFLQGKYIAEDDTWKITNYVVELDRLKQAAIKQGTNVADPAILKGLKQEAANIVKNTVPNYAYVGSAVKTARILPIGNFMSFPSEIIRTTTNIAEQGLKELRHIPAAGERIIGSNITPYINIEGKGLVKNNNPMYATGFKRLTGMATTLTVVPAAVVEGAKALYDVTQDELDALRQFVPEWSKNSTLVPIKDKDGELRYIDFSHSNAYDVIARPFRTLVNNIVEGQQNDRTLLSGFVNGVGEASAELMNPFISESIWTEATADLIIRGGRTKEGRQLYTDQTSAGDKAAIRFLHLGEALAPGYKQFVRLGQAAFGTPTKRGDELDIGPELAGFMGLRPIKVNPLDSMGFKIAEYQTGIRNARREFTGGFFGILRGGRIKPNDVIDRYFKSNRARFEVQKEMYKNINAAKILGVNTNKLQQEFKDRQLSPKTYRDLELGNFEPYFPSEDIQRRFAEIARNLGDVNVFPIVAPTLRLMRNLFEQQPLGGRLDLQLGDFLLEDISTPSLPQQPQPITPAPRANVLPSSGLTQTETALLSPEEQIIRQRTRT